MDQPVKVANLARGQLNRENKFPPSPYAPENLVSRVQPSRPASVCSFFILRLNLVLTHGIPSISARRPFIYLNHHTPSGQSRGNRVTQLRIDGVHCRDSAGTGPVVFKIVPVTGAVIFQTTMDQLMYASLFAKSTIGMKWACRKDRS